MIDDLAMVPVGARACVMVCVCVCGGACGCGCVCGWGSMRVCNHGPCGGALLSLLHQLITVFGVMSPVQQYRNF